ncbi:hypothetical protein CPB86DRAFT_323635 [Serendipita vermifera]|nr:hypothetical protein CPB86DRAFT_323635 [Serendipita vermifera]
MGGFHAFVREEVDKGPLVHDCDKPYYPLHRGEVMRMHRDRQLDLPLEAEIQDKGKTDWLAKTLVILQTSWFILQCIARGVAHLPLTELEVVTLAYTAMNVWIYIVWWNKPRNVDRPVCVYISRDKAEERRKAVEPRGSKDVGDWIGDILKSILPGFDAEDYWSLDKFTGVPTFYAGTTTGAGDRVISIIVSSAVGTVFGAIHCIAWSHSFPSHTEQHLWRLSSIAIICVPASLFIAMAIFLTGNRIEKRLHRTNWLSLVMKGLEYFIAWPLLAILTLFGPLLYVVSRVISRSYWHSKPSVPFLPMHSTLSHGQNGSPIYDQLGVCISSLL